MSCEALKRKFAWFDFYLDVYLKKKKSGIKIFGNHMYFSFQLNIANLWCEHCVVFFLLDL